MPSQIDCPPSRVVEGDEWVEKHTSFLGLDYHELDQRVRSSASRRRLRLSHNSLGQPARSCLPAAIFYHARAAVARSAFDCAAALLHDAVAVANASCDHELVRRSQIWQAYCQARLGNDRLAQAITRDITGDSSTSTLTDGEVLLVRGLIAAKTESLPTAQEWFEQARDAALYSRDHWLEALCCAHLADLLIPQGLMERAAQMIRRVEQLNQAGMSLPQILAQVRAANVQRLRLLGEVDAAQRAGLPFPVATGDSADYERGRLVLNTMAVAGDSGNFALAEQACEQAAAFFDAGRNDSAGTAELLRERAWLRLRQGRLAEAHADIRRALALVDDPISSDNLHASVIAALIDLERGDLDLAGQTLYLVCERFRATGHTVGLVSTLLHIAAYHWHNRRPGPTREALAESLTLMRAHGLYGAFYWHPPTMVTLCRLATQGDIWGNEAPHLAEQLGALHGSRLVLESTPEDAWGDFAASLAARRLASGHLADFAPLIHDPRPQVRLRAARVLEAAGDTAALTHLQSLHYDPDAHLRREVAQYLAIQVRPTVVVHSFGRFQVVVGGRPLTLRTAGTRKALALFGALLVARDHGLESSDLALLLWPYLSPNGQRNGLYATISALRRVLRDALGGYDPIEAAQRRYRLKLQAGRIWWDWQALRGMVYQTRALTDIRREAQRLYREPFMEGFFDLLPRPTGLDRPTSLRWDEIHERLHDLVEEHAAQAAGWMARLNSPADL